MRTLDELANEICTLTGHLNAANHRWLTLIAEFDRRTGWSDSATQSCAHWLNWKCGIALGAAREKVRVARALESLPKVSAAMATGKLSYSKAREITRIGNAENEDYLLMIAEHGTAAHVERLVRAYRRCQDAEELSREARQQESRSMIYRYDDDGSLVVTCRLPAEAGAKFLKAIDVALEDVAAGTSECRVPFSARRADALTVVAESVLARGLMEARGTDTHQIVVHVAAETLRSRAAGCCEFEQVPRWPPRPRAGCLRCQRRRPDRRRGGRAAQCRAQDAHDLRAAAPRAQRPRQGLSLSRMRQQPIHRCASCRALGQWWRDEAVQSRVALPVSSPRRA